MTAWKAWNPYPVIHVTRARYLWNGETLPRIPTLKKSSNQSGGNVGIFLLCAQDRLPKQKLGAALKNALEGVQEMTDRKLDALKQICGTARPDRREPAASGEALEKLPRAPATLDADGKDLWNGLGRELLAEGTLTRLNLAQLELLCLAWSRVRRLGDQAKASDQALVAKLLGRFGRAPKRLARRRWSPY